MKKSFKNNHVLNESVTVNQIMIKTNNKEKSFVYSIEMHIYFGIKRLFDILCSLLGVLVMIPVAIITKICYLISGDFKSIFYKQKRIGKNGKFIYIYISLDLWFGMLMKY